MPTRYIQPSVLFYLVISLLCITNMHNAYALESDKKAPMKILANKAEIDQKKGVSVYQGNVKVTQGSMSLLATHIVVEHPRQKISLITATGSPAYYKSQARAKDIPIQAHAKTIIYDMKKSIITLIGDAFLRQGKNESRSQRIVYNIKTDYVKAYSTPKGKQISITINPNEK